MVVTTRTWARRGVAIGFVAFAILLYEAPNIALLAYKLGLPPVEPVVNGIRVDVRNGWYPAARNDSIVGRILYPSESPPLVTFHRPSIIWPWRKEGFMAMSYTKPVEAGNVESSLAKEWGKVVLLRSNPTTTPTRRLYVLPEVGLGFLMDDTRNLDDIVALSKIGDSNK
jgi:hypothetical protein